MEKLYSAQHRMYCSHSKSSQVDDTFQHPASHVVQEFDSLAQENQKVDSNRQQLGTVQNSPEISSSSPQTSQVEALQEVGSSTIESLQVQQYRYEDNRLQHMASPIQDFPRLSHLLASQHSVLDSSLSSSDTVQAPGLAASLRSNPFLSQHPFIGGDFYACQSNPDAAIECEIIHEREDEMEDEKGDAWWEKINFTGNSDHPTLRQIIGAAYIWA
jgi:hypothetical protein